MSGTPQESFEDLVVPDPRPGVPFADSEDVYAEDILTANRVPLTTQGLQAALPFVDDFLPVRNLGNLADLAVHAVRGDIDI